MLTNFTRLKINFQQTKIFMIEKRYGSDKNRKDVNLSGFFNEQMEPTCIDNSAAPVALDQSFPA